jgi:signal transduction histidine kinase
MTDMNKMRQRFSYFILLISLIFLPLSRGWTINDKSGERSLLASEKQKIDNLINKASFYSIANNDSCLIFAEEAYRLAQANNAPELQARALEISASYYYNNEEYQNSIKDIEKLLYLYSQTGDSLKKGYTYNLYGNACYNTGIYDLAFRSYYQATRIALDLNDNGLLARAYQNTGVLYDELKRGSDAMIYYEKALDLYRVLKDKDGEASINQNIGIILADQKKYREALGYYLSALKAYQELNDTISMAEMYLNLGTSYEEQGDYPRSLQDYNRALSYSLKKNYKYGIAYSFYSIGSVYRRTGDYQLALENLQKSLQISKMISLAENESDCHFELSKVYNSLGDYKTAYEELNEYHILNDSIYSQKVQDNIAEVELRLKMEMKDQEIENLRNERQEAVKDMIRRTIGMFSIITLTLIIFGVSFYYSRILKKANIRLTEEVDERIRAEKELISIKENLEERVTERTRQLEKAKLRAEESDRLKSAFIANMSHEIRTPLNAITGFSGLLLREDITPEKRKEYNDHVIKNNKVLVNMIEDLIDTSKIESGNLQLHPSLINIRQFLYRLNEPIIDNLSRKNKPFIQVNLDNFETESGSFVADPIRLQQVLWHLLDNAVKFTREGSIHYGCIQNHQNVLFYVKDTGIGIPEEFRDIVFEKFRQLDESAKRKYGGTGLGLYYARKIAEMMGGKLWFEPNEQGGSVFYFSLPSVTEISENLQ